jgi:nitroreductase
MTISPEIINQYIRSRRTITPDFFTGEEVSKEIIETIIGNATWAPTHKNTQPWRFILFYENGLQKLSEYVAEYYKAHTPPEQFSNVKYEKNRQKVLQSACVIAICLKRSTSIEIPEWEELAAVACAVENIWLTLAVYNLGGYWSSPESMLKADDFLQLKTNEKCLGVFYLGHVSPGKDNRKRLPAKEKITWITV